MEWPEYCCPQCKGELTTSQDSYKCSACSRVFPVVLGIPDFRIYPDPYIDYTNDHAKGRLLLRIAEKEKYDFEAMLRLYWKITPEVPADRAEHYIRSACMSADRGRRTAANIALRAASGEKLVRVVEIGCGTGGFLVGGAKLFANIVGVDIAFRWLVIARKRLEENGLSIPLVCACAEHLPFKSGTVDLVVADAVIEHTQNQTGLLREANRLLRDRGILELSTVNRFSLTPEPHVRLWGVGFLPRSWMGAYVRLVRGISYRQHRLLSAFELTRLLRRAGFDKHQCSLPTLGGSELARMSAAEKSLFRIYCFLRRLPVVRHLLIVVAPLVEVMAAKTRDAEGPNRGAGQLTMGIASDTQDRKPA